MTPAPDLPADPALIAALIAWQAELGADEAIGDAPLDRFALPAAPAAAAPPVAPSSGKVSQPRRSASRSASMVSVSSFSTGTRMQSAGA